MCSVLLLVPAMCTAAKQCHLLCPLQSLTPAPFTPGSDAEAAAAAAGAGAAMYGSVDDELLKLDFSSSFLDSHAQRTALPSSMLASMAPDVQDNMHSIDNVRGGLCSWVQMNQEAL